MTKYGNTNTNITVVLSCVHTERKREEYCVKLVLSVLNFTLWRKILLVNNRKSPNFPSLGWLLFKVSQCTFQAFLIRWSYCKNRKYVRILHRWLTTLALIVVHSKKPHSRGAVQYLCTGISVPCIIFIRIRFRFHLVCINLCRCRGHKSWLIDGWAAKRKMPQ